MAQSSVFISIVNGEGVVFEGEAKALSSYNEGGIFDVLPMHANFISIIKQAVVVHHHSGEKKEIKIGIVLFRINLSVINAIKTKLPTSQQRIDFCDIPPGINAGAFGGQGAPRKRSMVVCWNW